MTTTSTHETEITADPHVPLVRITREFDAPPEKVFRAHTDPELVVQWLGPRRHEMRIEHYDCALAVRSDPECGVLEHRLVGIFALVREPDRGGNARGHGPGRNVFDDNGVGADLHPVPDVHRTENRAPAPIVTLLPTVG